MGQTEMLQTRAKSKGLPVLLGCFLALVVIMAWEAASSHAEYSWTSTSDSVTGDVHKLRVRKGHWRLDVDYKGDVEITADDSGIARVGPDSFLEIEERSDGERRRLLATPGPGGRPEIAWLVDREPAEFDREARKWLAEVLPRIYRTTGLDAAGRVRRLLAAGGAEAVLEEIGDIGSDRIERLYFEQLLAQTELSPSELERVMRRLAREVGSDHEMVKILTALSVANLRQEATANAFVVAAGTIGSDYELRRLLTGYLDRPDFDPAVCEVLIDAARTIGGDYDMAELLSRVIAVYPEDVALPVSFSRALQTIGSDYELRKALSAALRRPHLREDELDNLLVAAHTIGSDHDLAQLLIELAETYEGELPPSFFRAARTVGSDFDHGRVLSAVATRPNLATEALVAMLESSLSIGSDHDLAKFLIRFAGTFEIDDDILPAFERAAGTIGSDHHQQQVWAATGRGG